VFLRNLDCDFVQGYYFGKPMPGEEFEEFLLIQQAKPVVVAQC
jgi:EAL domain-containing protein (putative c-di-GMP-specific phosphodiesterase class I)